MDDFQKHVLTRLTEVEEGLRELRQVTWPVCQGLQDRDGPYANRKQKLSFFKFLERSEALSLLRLKERFMGRESSVADAELRWILVEEPRVGTG